MGKVGAIIYYLTTQQALPYQIRSSREITLRKWNTNIIRWRNGVEESFGSREPTGEGRSQGRPDHKVGVRKE